MTAASDLSLLFFHKRKKHGKLPVNQIFQPAWNCKIIQRKTPDRYICPENILYHLFHIVFHTAFTGCAAPAGKAPEAGSDIQFAHFAFPDLHLPGPLSYSSQKGARQLIAVAFFTSRTSVYYQNVHIHPPPLRMGIW